MFFSVSFDIFCFSKSYVLGYHVLNCLYNLTHVNNGKELQDLHKVFEGKFRIQNSNQSEYAAYSIYDIF